MFAKRLKSFRIALSSLITPPRSLLIALAGGILMGLTPAPFNAWGFAWIALAPLWFVLRQERSPRVAALQGLIWGLGYHGMALFWITGVHPMTWMGVPWLASLAIALFCWIFITLWGAIMSGLWAGLFHRLCGDRSAVTRSLSAPMRVLIGTALWCALEALWSYGPLYWTSLSYTQSPTNLVILHLGRLAGPFTVTAAIVAVNAFLAEAGLEFLNHRRSQGPRAIAKQAWRSRQYLGGAIALWLGLHLIGLSLYSQPLSKVPDQALKVGIIQGNIPNTIKLYEEGWRKAIEGYTTGYRTLASQGVDAVLTPETALPTDWTRPSRTRTSFYQAVLDEGVLTWLGAFGTQPGGITNSLFTVTGAGETVSTYDKVKLVPLGEYIPFQRWVGGLINRLSPLDAELIPGDPNQIFDTPFGRAIVSICYESAYPQHFRYQTAQGGQFILTASNNAHYSITMPAQHHAQDVMRAVETDRWAVRATNTGYSGIVDPHGRTQWISGINTYEIHADTVYRRQTQTLYVRVGNWLTPLLLGLATLIWGRQAWLNKHQPHSP